MKGLVSKISARGSNSKGNLHMQPPKPSIGFSKAPAEEMPTAAFARKTPTSLLSHSPTNPRQQAPQFPGNEEASKTVIVRQDVQPIQNPGNQQQNLPQMESKDSKTESLAPPQTVESHIQPLTPQKPEPQIGSKETAQLDSSNTEALPATSKTLTPMQPVPGLDLFGQPQSMERKGKTQGFRELKSQEGKLEEMPLPQIIAPPANEKILERETRILQPIQNTLERTQEKVTQIQTEAKAQALAIPLQQVMPRKPASPVVEKEQPTAAPQGLSIGRLVIEVISAPEAPLEVHKAPESKTRKAPTQKRNFQAPNSNLKFGLGQL